MKNRKVYETVSEKALQIDIIRFWAWFRFEFYIFFFFFLISVTWSGSCAINVLSSVICVLINT